MSPPKTRGGGTQSMYEWLTERGGTGIRLDRLATLVTGILATAWGSSVASLVSGVWSSFVIEPLRGIELFVRSLSATFTNGFTAIGVGIWSPLERLIKSFGPAAWIVAVVVVLVIAYGVNRGWSLRG